MRVVAGLLFFPRGGSAYVVRALAGCLGELGCAVTVVSGSREGTGDARAFYAGLDVRAVDFRPALASAEPAAYAAGPGEAPLQGSFEDRPDAPDVVFAAIGDAAYARHVDAWAHALDAAGAAAADVLYLHHLTPLNAAAERAAPGVPVVGHLHGTELLMLEAIDAGAGWPHARAWARRLRDWAAGCARLLVAPGNAARAAALLGVDERLLVPLANGFDPLQFRPLDVDRRAVWRRVLVDEPRGWRPGDDARVRYAAGAVDALSAGPVLLYTGRFTEVKRLELLLEAFAEARPRMPVPASLVLVGGRPGEWEGEHPAESIERLGLEGAAYLAGWHPQDELPELLGAADLLVLPSAREGFGQVLVEAMACGVAPVAAASPGPAQIIDDGVTGWLVQVDDRAALVAALIEAVADPDERARRAANALRVAGERFTWPAIAAELLSVLRAVQDAPESHARTVA